MKKVLIAITTLFGGGAERVVSVWANQLTIAGYDVSLLLYGRSETEYAVNEQVKIRTVAQTYTEYQTLSYLTRLWRMRRIIREAAPDVVINFLPRMQIWMMMASFGMKLRRIETVRVSPWEICKENKAEHFLWTRCFKRADAVIFQTAEQAEYFPRSVQNKSIVIPNPIAAQYRDSPKCSYSDTVKHFVAAGRITKQKNYPVMLDAFDLARKHGLEISLCIYGTGNETAQEHIQTMIEDKGLTSTVKLMGRTTDMLSVLQHADAFLMTSDYEGMPNALAEAMAVGLPCISTNCRTGPRDLIKDGESGFLVRVGDAAHIAEAIIKVAQLNAVQAEEIGRKAREKVLALCGEENSIARLIRVIEA